MWDVADVSGLVQAPRFGELALLAQGRLSVPGKKFTQRCGPVLHYSLSESDLALMSREIKEDQSMSRRVRFFRVAGVAGLFVLAAVLLGFQPTVLARPQSGELIEVFPIDPLPSPKGNDLFTGRAIPFKVKVNYAINSADNGDLAVYVEEYPKAAGGCRGNVHSTNGGGNARLQRGQGTVMVNFVWHGEASVYPGGYIELGANLWTPDRSRLIARFALSPPICYSFFPSGGRRID